MWIFFSFILVIIYCAWQQTHIPKNYVDNIAYASLQILYSTYIMYVLHALYMYLHVLNMYSELKLCQCFQMSKSSFCKPWVFVNECSSILFWWLYCQLLYILFQIFTLTEETYYTEETVHVTVPEEVPPPKVTPKGIWATL